MENKDKFDFKKEYDALCTIRDELRVKAHLAKADVKDELARLEERFRQIEEDFRRTRAHVQEPAETIGKKSTQIVHELRTAFETLRRRLNDPTN